MADEKPAGQESLDRGCQIEASPQPTADASLISGRVMDKL